MPAPTVAPEVPGSYMARSTLGQVNKIAATAVAKGVLVEYNATNDNFQLATAGAPVATVAFVTNKAALAADTKLAVIKKGPACVVATGAIAPHAPVGRSTTVAGRVSEVAPGAAGTIGRYIGKANGNEHDGQVLTAAVDGEAIWIDLNGGVS
jgi:hypothetical protein